MQAVKVLPKWQITLPKNIRQKLKIDVGDTIVVEERAGEIVMEKGEDHLRLCPKPPRPGNGHGRDQGKGGSRGRS